MTFGGTREDRIVLRSEHPDPVVADPQRLHAVAETGLLDTPPGGSLRPADPARRDVITEPVEASVNADYQYLLRALCQLIGHALHTTPDGGRVQLAVHSDDSGVRFTIADQGAKLATNVMQYVGLDAATQGNGLAFAMARAQIEAHGGRMEIEPAATPGNLVKVTLPVNL